MNLCGTSYVLEEWVCFHHEPPKGGGSEFFFVLVIADVQVFLNLDVCISIHILGENLKFSLFCAWNLGWSIFPSFGPGVNSMARF